MERRKLRREEEGKLKEEKQPETRKGRRGVGKERKGVGDSMGRNQGVARIKGVWTYLKYRLGATLR